VQRLRQAGQIDRWFFLRFGDPEWHLRWRLHGKGAELLATVLPQLRDAMAPFIEQGIIWRIEIDTYEREVERYGGDEGIEVAEQIFEADSWSAVQLVQQLIWNEDEAELRWRLALLGIDELLDDLGFSLGDKHTLVSRQHHLFEQEFLVDRSVRQRLAARLRSERAWLEALLQPTDDQHEGQGGASSANPDLSLPPRERTGHLSI
jgi:thiopeptide-type bacteriocin biosynthesis protein